MPPESNGNGRTVHSVYEKATLLLAGIVVTLLGSIATVSHDSVTRGEVYQMIRDDQERTRGEIQALSDRLSREEQSQAQMGRDVGVMAGRLGVPANPVTPH